jgi:hypothetical protein
MGRASLEAVLELSARQVAGPPQQGRTREGDIVWHGTQPGRVRLKERQLKVNKPRLRKKGRGVNKEVPIPADEAMPGDATGKRMLQILLNPGPPGARNGNSACHSETRPPPRSRGAYPSN